MRFATRILILLVLALAGTTGAVADIPTLSDDNSQLKIDPNSAAGVYSWVVDGTELLYQQWFWVRTNNDTREYALAPPAFSVGMSQFSGNSGAVQYIGDGLSIMIGFLLNGGEAGSLASDLIEVIRIKNVSQSPVSLDFFQYADLRLNPPDTVQFIDNHSVKQTSSVLENGGRFLNETIVNSDGLIHHQAATGSVLLDSLNDGGITTLNDADYAQGAATWAFQWEKQLSPGGSFVITKDLNISDPQPVPEPSAVALLFSLVGISALLYRKRLSEAD